MPTLRKRKTAQKDDDVGSQLLSKINKKEDGMGLTKKDTEAGKKERAAEKAIAKAQTTKKARVCNDQVTSSDTNENTAKGDDAPDSFIKENQQVGLIDNIARSNVGITPNPVKNIKPTALEVEKGKPKRDQADNGKPKVDEPENGKPKVDEPENGKPKLDKEVLYKLGTGSKDDDSIPTKHYSDLQVRWKHWLLRGLPKKQKDKLVKKYRRKGKCPLEAPKLNPEIEASMADDTKKKDRYFMELQNQLGCAMAALGPAISVILQDEEESINRSSLLRKLCDAGKLLADLHHSQSVCRRAFISPTLDKLLRPALDNLETDEWLYGAKMSQKVKAMEYNTGHAVSAAALLKGMDIGTIRRVGEWLQNSKTFASSCNETLASNELDCASTALDDKGRGE